jgi:hypothetical protein
MYEKIVCVLILSLCLAMIFFTDVRRVHAALGETVESVATDREALSALRSSTAARNGFTIHEIDSGSTVVREYVSSSGIVFGIAWNGLIHPDLVQLLGSYAGEYQEALQQTPRRPGHRQIQVKTDRIIVQKWGHMRNLQGRAYAPALIPYGADADEIN